jgi:replicative DNA helicase
VITVFENLTQLGKAEDVGGLAYLNAMAQNTPSAANIRRYAEIVRDRGAAPADYRGRRYLRPGLQPARQGNQGDARRGRIAIFAIAEQGARGAAGWLAVQPLLTQVVERIDELYSRENQSEITGVPTGFIDLDRMTSGLQPGDLVIVAGRPSMGKTAFSVNIGENVAIEAGLPVACSRWRWAAPSWRCVCWVRSASSTSTACARAA